METSQNHGLHAVAQSSGSRRLATKNALLQSGLIRNFHQSILVTEEPVLGIPG
jgi:hypothetical protein